jgi:hypothetical protein
MWLCVTVPQKYVTLDFASMREIQQPSYATHRRHHDPLILISLKSLQ